MRSRGGFALVAALTVDSIGNGLFAPLSLVYFVRLTDVPLPLVGVLLTAANLVALPLPVWAGTLADRFGPRYLVVAAEAAMALGFLAFAGVSGPVGILLASTLVAAGVRVFWCTIFTLVADYADGRPGGVGVDTWYAISNAARTAGLALGGLATGIVVADGSTAGYRAVAYGAAVFLALAAALVAFGVRAPHRAATAADPVGYRELLRDRPYLGLVALNTVYAMTSMMLALALPTVVLTGAGPPWLTALLLAANAVLIAVLSAPLVRRLTGVRRTRSIAGAAAAVGALVRHARDRRRHRRGDGHGRAGARHAALHGGRGGARADLTAAAAAAAPAAARGRYLATFQYSFAAASVIAPAFFGGLYAVGHALPFLVLGLVNALSVPALLRLEHRADGALTQPTDQRPAAHRAPSISAAASARGATLTSTSRCWLATVRGRSLEHVLQPPGVGGREVLAAGEVRPPRAGCPRRPRGSCGRWPRRSHRRHRRVGAAVALEAAAAELGRRADHRRRVAGAEPDRVDADAALRGGLGGVDRLDAGGVGAVGEQHDDLRARTLPRRPGAAAGRPASAPVPGSDGRHLRVDLGDRVDGLEHRPRRSPCPGRW